MSADWKLVSTVVARSIARSGETLTTFSQRARIHRSTLHTLSKGQELSDATLDRIEGALGLPRDLTRYIANHDVEAIRAANPDDPDLVRWLEHQFKERQSDQQQGV